MKQILTILTLTLIVSQANSQVRKKIRIGGNLNYHIGTRQQNTNINPLLFMNSAFSLGGDLSYIPKKGSTKYKLSIDYLNGINDKAYIGTYAKENNIEYTNYNFTKPRPMGLSIMMGPQFFIFPHAKKLPLMWIDIKGGAIFSNQQKIQFTRQGITTKEILNKPISFVYEPSLIINVVKTKKMFYNARIGYSNFGGITVGVNITSSCCLSDCCCSKCGPCCKTPSK